MRPAGVLTSLLTVALLAMGCEESVVDPPDASEPPGPDALLGTLVMEGSAARDFTFRSFYIGDRVYVLVHQAAGADAAGMPAEEELRFFSVDDMSLVVTEHPAPPVRPADRFLESVDVDGNGLALGTITDAGGELAFFDGSTWADIPPPPVPTAELDGELVSRSNGRILARSRTRVFLFDGMSWAEVAVPPDATDVRLGPWDSEGFRIVYVTGDELGTQRYSGSTAEPRGDAETLRGLFGGLIGSAVNGDTSFFQIAAGSADVGGFSVLLQDGSLRVVGRVEPGTFFPAPGSDTSLFVVTGVVERGLRFSSSAELGDIAMHPFRARITCGCDAATDPECACVEHDPLRLSFVAAPTGDRVAMTIGDDDVEGVRAIYVRVIDLPIVESPFVDRDAECDLACDADGGAALECVISTWGLPECVAVGSVAPGSLFDAGPRPLDGATGVFGATMTGTLLRSNDGSAPILVEVVPRGGDGASEVTYEDGGRFSIACAPGSDYQVTLRSADEHRPIAFDVTSPADGESLALGDFMMVIGEPLGTAWGETAVAPTTVVSPADGTMVVVGADGWYVVKPDAERGFVTTHIVGAPAISQLGVEAMVDAPRVILANDDAFVLAETATGLIGIDLTTAAIASGVTGEYDLSAVTFADSAPVAMIARPGGMAGTPMGPTIVGWADGTLRELLSITPVGEDDWMDGAGARVLRAEGAEVVEYDVATGTRSVIVPSGTGRWMRLGNDDLVGVTRAGRARIGTCWLDVDGCDATVIRADGGETQSVSSFYGFAPSATTGFFFYTRREGGNVVPYRYSLSTGSVAVADVSFSGVAFEWLQHRDAVTFEDAMGYRSVDVATGALLATEPGIHTARQRSNGEILLTREPCGAACDLVVLDAPAGSVRRIRDAGNAVFLGPDTRVEVTSAEGEVTVGARSVARGPEAVAPQPDPLHHLGAPCWPYSWQEVGAEGAPVGRTLYCTR